MGKIIRIRLSESDYEKVVGIAKATGKGISTFAKEVLLTGIKQELKDTALLNKLIQKIENLSEPEPQTQPLQQLQSQMDFERFKQLFLLLFSLIREHGRLVFVMPDKQQKFSQIADEIEKKISEL